MAYTLGDFKHDTWRLLIEEVNSPSLEERQALLNRMDVEDRLRRLGALECRVSLVNQSGGSCRRTDSLLGDNRFWPRSPCSGWRLRHDVRLTAPSGFATALRKWLDGVSDVLCILPARLRVSRLFATSSIRSRRRLPALASLSKAGSGRVFTGLDPTLVEEWLKRIKH